MSGPDILGVGVDQAVMTSGDHGPIVVGNSVRCPVVLEQNGAL